MLRLVSKLFLVDFIVEHCESDDLAVIGLGNACTTAVFHDVLRDERCSVDSLGFEELEGCDGFLVVAELKTLDIGVAADSWRRRKKRGGIVSSG